MSSRIFLKTVSQNLRKVENSSRAFSAGVVKCADTAPKDLKAIVTQPEAIEREKALKGYITITQQEDVSLVSGVPEEHIKTRTVRIYQPAKNAMQSGTNNINYWQIDFDNRERWENALMGWSSTGDPLSNMKVEFASQEEAIEHCDKMKWRYYIQKPNVSNPKPRSYGANFSWNKRTRTTTK